MNEIVSHGKPLYKQGLCICGFPSGLSDLNSQEIVLKCPRGYRAIKFRLEKVGV